MPQGALGVCEDDNDCAVGEFCGLDGVCRTGAENGIDENFVVRGGDIFNCNSTEGSAPFAMMLFAGVLYRRRRK